jgi:hypothetical protein
MVMKKALLTFLFAIPILLQAQPNTKVVEGKYEIFEICNSDFSSKELYNKFKIWIANQYTEDEGGIIYDNDSTKIQLKAVNNFVKNTITSYDGFIRVMDSESILYKIDFECKDKKFRIRLYDITISKSLDTSVCFLTSPSDFYGDYNKSIKDNNSKIDSLNKIDSTIISKGEWNKIKGEKINCRNMINRLTSQHKIEYDNLLSTIDSIKKNLAIKEEKW